MIRSIAATSAAVMIVLVARSAHAQNAAAETLFADGERFMKEGKLPEACDAFAASNRVEPRAGTLINLGLCREQNHQLATAWSAYKDALGRAKDPKKTKVANERIAAIEPRLSYLTVSVPDESRIDGLSLTRNGIVIDPALWNRAVPVDGGTYVIVGHAPGHDEWSKTIEVPVELGKVSLEVPRMIDTSITVAPKPTVIETEHVEEHAATPSMFTGQRKIALGVAAIGLAAVGGGLVLGMQAKKLDSDAHDLCPNATTPCVDGDRATDISARAHTRAIYADVAFGTAAAALVGAGVLWFLGAPTAEGTVAVTPHASATSASLDLSVRF